MNETMIENWNSVVTKSDIVYHLGDVSFEKDLGKRNYLLRQLHGEKHLIWGNHDKNLRTTGWQDHFHSASELRKINVPDGTPRGRSIILCHYAMRVWDQSHYGSWHLFGHSHGKLPDDPTLLSCDVGVDCWNFTPVSMDQLEAVMSKKTFTPVTRRVRNVVPVQPK